MKSPHSMSVPKAMLATYEAITTLTDTFCRDKLNDEYPRPCPGDDGGPLPQAS